MWTCKTHGPRKEAILPYAIIENPKGSDYIYLSIDGKVKYPSIPKDAIKSGKIICGICEKDIEFIEEL